MSHHGNGLSRFATLPGVRLITGPTATPYGPDPDDRYVAVSE
ncbi:hypothetical protein [Streptosporangium sp. 'caverna']|nr:hypothetical protein [Streptosporangium sp. 'caverna']